MRKDWILAVAMILLFLITLSIKSTISADAGDYLNVAKFFAGEHNSKIRSSHSYFYGFISSPFVKLTGNFVGMKIMTLIWLILLILSLYYISKKDKKTLLIVVTAPIFWYMAPVINPIQIASLFFLWGYYFMKKYDETDKISYLIYSGIFVGGGWVFWDTILYFLAILGFCFLINKRLIYSFIFIISVLVGLSPRLILDQFLFNFAFYSILKSFVGGWVNLFWKGVYGAGGQGIFGSRWFSIQTIINFFSVLIVFPLFSFLLLKPANFKENKKTVFFLILSLLLILTNPQIRYTLTIIPIILLNLGKMLTKKQLKKQIIISLIISLLVIAPYVIQIKYSLNRQQFDSIISNPKDLTISKEDPEELIKKDLDSISKDFPNQKFIATDYSDYHLFLARIYWGENISEFVSIEDYTLFLNNETLIFEKEFHPIPNLNDKREIWIKGGISKKTNDSLDYDSLRYALSTKTETDLNGFELVKSYKILNVFEKRANGE